MALPIVFHDGSLLSADWGDGDTLLLRIRLDNVWNSGSDRVVLVALTDVRNRDEVERVFPTLSATPGMICPDEGSPTIMALDVMLDSAGCLVAMEFLFLKPLNVVCSAVTCDGLPIPFVS
ncbi:MAG: hypothetical protein NTW19_08995 [Planctomycetota bacterium]|nr:hypothetical protein [Planctomycetota bacterium]